MAKVNQLFRGENRNIYENTGSNMAHLFLELDAGQSGYEYFKYCLHNSDAQDFLAFSFYTFIHLYITFHVKILRQKIYSVINEIN